MADLATPPFEQTAIAEAANDAVVEMYGERQVRWYQAAARNEAIDALANGLRRILIVLPTGAGKTMTSGLIFCGQDIRRVLNVPAGRKLRLLFVAHKHRLLTQAEREYAEAENIEFIMQSAFSAIPQEIIDEGWDITCIDEAHHEAMSTIQYQLETLTQAPIIGLTARPDRADGYVIKFEKIIEPISRAQAVAEGWLAETELYSFVDASGRDKTQMVIQVLTDFAEYMEQTMVFMRTKKECRAVGAFLEDLGYNVVVLESQSEQVVNEVLDQFSKGEIQFIVNCNKINEGVDVVGCTDVVLGRQFGSYPQLNQVIGRASRPDSDCRVWELVNPLSGTNLDTTVVVGEPKEHLLYFIREGEWRFHTFEYDVDAQNDAYNNSLAFKSAYPDTPHYAA